MGFYNRFRIKNTTTTLTASSILNIPIDTVIVKDNGMMYSKNAKGAWEKIFSMDVEVIEKAINNVYTKGESDFKFLSTSGGIVMGDVVVDGNFTATTITETSAKKYKDNIQNIENGLETVLKLQGVTYDWKKDGVADIGFIADDVNSVLPQLVKEENNEIEGMNYGKLTAVLVEAIKELNTTIIEQQKQIDELTKKIK